MTDIMWTVLVGIGLLINVVIFVTSYKEYSNGRRSEEDLAHVLGSTFHPPARNCLFPGRQEQGSRDRTEESEDKQRYLGNPFTGQGGGTCR